MRQRDAARLLAASVRRRIPCVCALHCSVACSVRSTIVSSAYAAEVKGTSASTPSPSFPPAPRSRAWRKRAHLERGEHTSFCSPICRRRRSRSSIRVEGKATGRLEIGSVDTRRVSVPRTDPMPLPPASGSALEDEIEKLKDSRAVPAGGVAGGRGAEDADQQPGAAADAPAAGATQAAAASPTGASFSPHRRAHRRGAEGDPRNAVKLREIDRQINDLEGKLVALAPVQEERTEVKVFVNAGRRARCRHRPSATRW